jgi:hypothetical protein
MNLTIALKSMYVGFTVDYGSQLPHEIKNTAEGPELVISYRSMLGAAGTFVVRKATAEDATHPGVQPDMWVIYLTCEHGSDFSPYGWSFEPDDIIIKLVTLATEVAGPSLDLESAEIVLAHAS